MGKTVLIFLLIILGIAVAPYLITFMVFLIALMH